jgi:hypothetical protein
MECILRILLGISVIYFMPGIFLLRYVISKKPIIILFSPFISIIAIGLIYSLIGLIHHIRITSINTICISLSVCIISSIAYNLNGNKPILKERNINKKIPRAISYAALILCVIYIIIIGVYNSSNLQQKIPNISDTLLRLNIVQSLNLEGIPTVHYVQPNTKLLYYFYTYIPCAALINISHDLISVTVAWWINVMLQVIGYTSVLCYILLRFSKNIKLGLTGLIVILYGSSFGFVFGLLGKIFINSGSLEKWLYSLKNYTGDLVFTSTLTQAAWCPHHFLSLVVVCLISSIYWNFDASLKSKTILTGILIGYLAGSSTFIFMTIVIGLISWISFSATIKNWNQVKYWFSSLLIAFIISLPFIIDLLDSKSSGSGLRIAHHAYNLTTIPLVNILTGLILEITYIFIEFGLVFCILIIFRNDFKNKFKVSTELSFYVFSSLAMLLFLLIFSSGPGRDSINNLGIRSLMIPYLFLTIAITKLDPQTSTAALSNKCTKSTLICAAIIIFSLLPSFYSFIASMAYLRRLPSIPKVAVWANINLPRDGVITFSSELLRSETFKLPQSLRSLFFLQRWIPYEQTIDIETCVMDLNNATDIYPKTLLQGRPIYLVERNHGSINEHNIIYKDNEYVLTRFFPH